mmetsp:Transcript_140008/g.355012  ORF Transcript_140008/g.355012 Transcript_140008/m.355012 type:complete len:480 (-) Transcript_140008:88-1527(-)
MPPLSKSFNVIPTSNHSGSLALSSAVPAGTSAASEAASEVDKAIRASRDSARPQRQNGHAWRGVPGQSGLESPRAPSPQEHPVRQACSQSTPKELCCPASTTSLQRVLGTRAREPGGTASGAQAGVASTTWQCEDVSALKEELTVVAAERDVAQADAAGQAEIARSMTEANHELGNEISALRKQLKHSHKYCGELNQEASDLRIQLEQSNQRVCSLEQEVSSLCAALQQAEGTLRDMRLHNQLSSNLDMAETKALRFASQTARRVLLGDGVAARSTWLNDAARKDLDSMARYPTISSMGSTASGEMDLRCDTPSSPSSSTDYTPRVWQRMGTSSSLGMPESIAEIGGVSDQSSAQRSSTRSDSRVNSTASDMVLLPRGASTPRAPKEPLLVIGSGRSSSRRTGAQVASVGSSTSTALQAAAEAAATAARSRTASLSAALSHLQPAETIEPKAVVASDGNVAAVPKARRRRYSNKWSSGP